MLLVLLQEWIVFFFFQKSYPAFDTQKQGEPIKDRKREREELPSTFESLLSAIQLARKASEQFRQGDEKYNHLDNAQIEKVSLWHFFKGICLGSFVIYNRKKNNLQYLKLIMNIQRLWLKFQCFVCVFHMVYIVCLPKVEKAIGEKQEWVDKNMGVLTSTPLHVDLPVTVSQVRSEKGTFDAVVNPVINKPKPKPKVKLQ